MTKASHHPLVGKWRITGLELWDDEMDEASGDGHARLKPDGALTGRIRFHLGDVSSFSARRW